jgi:hypothetical protein
MEFLDISSLGAAYRYACQNRAEAQTKDAAIWAWEPLTKKAKKGQPQPNEQRTEINDGQYQDNQSNPQAKKDTGKTKKDTGKWCDFHKIPWHNTADCLSKQSLVVESESL